MDFIDSLLTNSAASGLASELGGAFTFLASAILAADAPTDLTTAQKASLVLGMMILVYTVVRLGVKRRMALASGQPSPRPTFYTDDEPLERAGGPIAELFTRGTRGHSGAGGAELEALVVQLRETGREVEARLETKIRYAQRLLQEAEQTLTALETARARAERHLPDPHAAYRESLAAAEHSLAEAATPPAPAQTNTPPSTAATNPAPPIVDEPPATSAPTGSVLSDRTAGGDRESILGPAVGGDGSERGDRIHRSDAGASTALPEGLAEAERSLESATQRSPETASQRRVLELAADGLSSTEIAREVERPVGEVELILALGRGSES